MRHLLTLGLGASLLFFALVLPNNPGGLTWSGLQLWPLELPIILLLLVALGRTRGVATVLALVLVAICVLKLADFAAYAAYNRTFNPIVDLFLIGAGLDLLRAGIGILLTVLLTLGAILGMALLFLALRSGFKAWGRLPVPSWARNIAAAGVFAFGALTVADAGHHLGYWQFETSPPGTTATTQLTVRRGLDIQATATELAKFRQDAQTDPMEQKSGLLDRLAGRDVLLIWIESYGRASFDNPLYAPTHGATLAKAERALNDRGLSVKSGWLTSPTAGGQSWLAHGTLASGLWTTDQGHYIAMIASGRKWLFEFARDAGYRTSAVMPAITKGWPESLAMGFDHIFAAADIPYRGTPFNWVTMPDQFTLATYAQLLPPDPRPDFIQVALISSHAPWTPVPDVLPWEAVGDGTEFNNMAAQGPTPRDLWKDRDDVRDAYRRAIDYSLEVTFAHIARLGDPAPLVIVIGDHQPAGFVAGNDNRDVPVHLIGPAELVSRIDRWNWSDGLVPAQEGPVRRMDTFRNDFLAAFTSRPKLAQVQP